MALQASRYPADFYPALKSLLGKHFSDPVAVAYRSTFPNSMVNLTESGKIGFQDGDIVYTVEELVAFLLSHAKQQAIKHGNEDVSGAVITVSAFSFFHLSQYLTMFSLRYRRT